jgi:preprotein translocase subunit SecD
MQYRNRLPHIFVLTILFLYVVLPDSISHSFSFLGVKQQFSISIPRIPLNIGPLNLDRTWDLKKGLDIQGGVEILMEAQVDQIDQVDRATSLESLKTAISRRIDLFGVSESVIRTSIIGDDHRLIIELPGVTDPESALALIGETAKLEFAIPNFIESTEATQEPQFVGFTTTDLTGSDLRLATVTFDTDNRQPGVSLEFKDAGRDKFAKLTTENIGNQITILLDGEIVTSPVVQTAITDGRAVISGGFTEVEEAKRLAVQLNAGALPVPVSVLSQKNIPPSLGQIAIDKSVQAGMVGILAVVIFMIGNYGFLGVVSTIGLILYGIYTLAIYKLFSVVLTLPGIAGLLLSIGMAVDSSILIFERLREEVRAGRDPHSSLEVAFGRAWESIKDSNTATIITSLILFNPFNWSFLNVSGSVRGFAVTLLIGVLVSLFTGVFVTRNLLRVLYPAYLSFQKKLPKPFSSKS